MRQLQVARVIDGEPVLAGERHDPGFLWSAVNGHPQPGKAAQEGGGIGLGQPSAPLMDDERIAHLEPPQAWDPRRIASDALQRQGCGGVVFVLEGPTRGDGRIEDKRHQYLWPSCRADSSSSTVIFPVRLRSALIAFDRLIDFLLPKVRLGHDPGDGPPMTRDNDGLPALDIVEQLGEMRFGVRSLNFAHAASLFLVGQFDWSEYAAHENRKSTRNRSVLIGLLALSHVGIARPDRADLSAARAGSRPSCAGPVTSVRRAPEMGFVVIRTNLSHWLQRRHDNRAPYALSPYAAPDFPSLPLQNAA